MLTRASTLGLMSWVLLFGGCAHYEYDIVSPPEIRQHVGFENEVLLHLPPLEYRLISVEDHLVVRVFNPTSDMVQLMGERSSVVDTTGQSHPLRSQAIPPNDYMK